ncbi:MAG: hypothetical protein AAB955_00030 [Patescibacteria group bacterium]
MARIQILRLRFFERIPAFCYPWGRVAYEERLELFVAKYGPDGVHSYCVDLALWHAFVHFIFAIVLVFLLDVVYDEYRLVAAGLSIWFACFILWQEWFDQPRRLKQTLPKSILDTLVWLLPLLAYWIV